MKDIRELQLASLFSLLSKKVPNENDLGPLIGYSLLYATFEYQKVTENKDESKILEIRSYYSRLSLVIQNINALCADDSYHQLCTLETSVTESLPFFLEGKSRPYGELGCSLIASLRKSPRSYQDELRKMGLKIYRRVQQRGELKRIKDSLLEDYNDVLRSLGGKP